MHASCYRDFTAAKILPNPELENKRKIFIGGFSKQYGFASQEFLVVRGNGWGFLWSGRHTRRLKGGGGMSKKPMMNPKPFSFLLQLIRGIGAAVNMTPKSFLRPNPTLFSIKPKGLKIEKLLFGCKQINNLRVLLRQLELGYPRKTYQDTPYLHKLPHNSL